MKRIINKVLIIIYALYFHLIYYKPKGEENNRNILIIYYGIIGDAVLFADYLAMFHKIFPIEKGYQIEVLCFKSCRQIWQNIFENEYHLNFLDIYVDEAEKKWSSYRDVVFFFQKKYYQKIFALPIANPRGDRLVYNIAGREKIICGENESPGKWGIQYLYHRYFYEHAYNARIQDPIGTMEIRRYANLIRRYADFPVPIKISHIKVQNGSTVAKYCVIGLGASTPEKIWEPEKYLEIMQYLWDKYHLESYICGEEKEMFLYEKIQKTGKCNHHIKSYIGRTNFKEWVTLIKGASLYIGNDSAGVHIAAAVSTPAIVIVGKWQYERFFPYDKELNIGSEILPYPVFSELQYECINCREKYMRKGIGNKKCKKALKAGRPCLCVADITVQKVMDIIDKTIAKYNLR